MILWRLRGYSDPEGEWEGGVAECALERAEDGYRFLVTNNGEILSDETIERLETARGKRKCFDPICSPVDGARTMMITRGLATEETADLLCP